MLSPIQRGLFCFTSMVTVAKLLELFGIQNFTSTVLVAVLVFFLFYARVRRREDAPSEGPK